MAVPAAAAPASATPVAATTMPMASTSAPMAPAAKAATSGPAATTTAAEAALAATAKAATATTAAMATAAAMAATATLALAALHFARTTARCERRPDGGEIMGGSGRRCERRERCKPTGQGGKEASAIHGRVSSRTDHPRSRSTPWRQDGFSARQRAAAGGRPACPRLAALQGARKADGPVETGPPLHQVG